MDEQDKIITETLRLLDLTRKLSPSAFNDLVFNQQAATGYEKFAASIKALVAGE